MGILFLMILNAKHFQLNKSFIKLCNKPNDIACFGFESDTFQYWVHFCPYHSQTDNRIECMQFLKHVYVHAFEHFVNQLKLKFYHKS